MIRRRCEIPESPFESDDPVSDSASDETDLTEPDTNTDEEWAGIADVNRMVDVEPDNKEPGNDNPVQATVIDCEAR